MEAQISHLCQTLLLLRQYKLFLNRAKYQFAQAQLEYLGHIIFVKGVSVVPVKIDGIKVWPLLKTIKV